MAAIKKYVRFYVQSRKKWATLPPKPRSVVLSFAYQGKVLCSLTGISALMSDWDEKKQRVKTHVKRSADVNKYLDNLESKINDIYFAALAAGDDIDNRYILDRLKNKEKKEEPQKTDMINEWGKYLEIHRLKHHKDTLKGMKAAKDKFERYCKKNKVRPSLDDINATLLADYANYLLGIGNSNNTIHTAIKRMNIFMSFSMKAGMHNNKQYNSFNLPERVGRLNFLEWHEVKKLIDLKIDDPYKNDVRNIFVFGCLTALRHGDIANITREDVQPQRFEGVDGVFYSINFRQRKTDRIQKIPMLPEAYEIFRQYVDKEGRTVFPKVPLQVLNRYIKDIGKEAGLTDMVAVDVYRGNTRETTYKCKWEILSSHLGRHTFISVAASRELPVHEVAEIAGQNPKTTMRHYAGIIDREKFLRVIKEMKFDAKDTDIDQGTKDDNPS